ncbi:hypothetical protein PUN28_019212 [Cardiocondyla obscurior]|uniref:Uncharacterized protein n=1 Tax=Cardiocondyla obscurior TaxID=286306 RepID=A0AAW2EEB1_9HYME
MLSDVWLIGKLFVRMKTDERVKLYSTEHTLRVKKKRTRGAASSDGTDIIRPTYEFMTHCQCSCLPYGILGWERNTLVFFQ